MKSTTIWFLCIAAAIVGILFGIGTLERADDIPLPQEQQNPPSTSESLVTFRLLEEADFVAVFDEFGRALPAVDGENLVTGDRDLKSESLSIELEVDGYIEYKALMGQGDTLVYSWQVRGGSVYYDFHSHPPRADPDFFTRYKEGEGQSDRGTILAGYSGQHGWYWLNLGDQPVTIDLKVAGFYDELVELPLY